MGPIVHYLHLPSKRNLGTFRCFTSPIILFEIVRNIAPVGQVTPRATRFQARDQSKSKSITHLYSVRMSQYRGGRKRLNEVIQKNNMSSVFAFSSIWKVVYDFDWVNHDV